MSGDPKDIMMTVTAGRDSAQGGDYGAAVTYLEAALAGLKRLLPVVGDAVMLRQLTGLQKQLQEELSFVKHCDKEKKGMRTEGALQRASSYGDMDDPRGSAGYDDGYRQAIIVQHNVSRDQDDPMVWRPPSREGRAGAPRPAAQPSRARISQDDNRVGPRPGGAAGPSGRAGSAPRRPAGGNAGANAGGNNYDKPWRQNMAGKGGEGGKGGGGAAAAAAKPKYTGPDQELAAMLERDIVTKKLEIKWDHIAGLEEAKRVLKEALVLPMLMPELFTGIRAPVKGVMMFGPPGTGKTMLAKAAASETNCTFFNVSSSTLASKYRGESERMVRVLFDMARDFAPSIIFIDEVDSLCSQRGTSNEHEASRRVKTELLTQIDGVHSAEDAGKDGAAGGGPDGEKAPPRHVFVLAATNFPWDIDEALRRRLEKRVYIPLPGQAQRLQLLKILLKDVDVAPDVNLEAVARQLDGYSGDDISNICRDAAMNFMRVLVEGKSPEEILALGNAQKLKRPVSAEDFQQAIRKIKPSVSKDDIKRHEEWLKVYGSL